MRREPPRGGFTLVEVLVALIVSAVVIAGARSLLEQLDDGATRIAAGAAAADREANGERMVRDLLLRLDVGTSEAARFAGGPDSVSFGSWCDVPRGWRERCVVSLVIRHGETRDSLLVATSTGLGFLTLAGAAPLTLRYLDDARDGGRWFRSWGAGITAPLAIAVAGARDTVILRIGERG